MINEKERKILIENTKKYMKEYKKVKKENKEIQITVKANYLF